MKIVDVCESFSDFGGGIRTYIHHKLAAGHAAGHEVVIVAPGTEDREERRLGGRIIFVKSTRSPFDDRYGLFLREAPIHEVLDREAPDLVEGSSPWGGGSFAASWPGPARRAFVFHTDAVAVWPETFFGRALGFSLVDRLSAPLWGRMRRLAERYDATIVSGSWLRDRLEAHAVPRSVVVPFGIDKTAFSPDLARADLRTEILAKAGAPPDARLLVASTRLDPEKRIGTLLAAFQKASRELPLALVICGRGSMESSVRRAAQKIPGVYLAGYLKSRDELASLLATADAFVHGSGAETFGLAVAEALCSGLPIIVPDRGGAAAFADDGYSELYRTGDASDCARAIVRLLHRDRGLLRAQCRLAADGIYDTQDHFDQLFRFYEELVETPRVADGRQPRVPTSDRAA